MGMGSASTSASIGIDNTNAGQVTINKANNTLYVVLICAALIAFALWSRKGK